MFEHEYVGNIHIHSIHSDGGATISDIAGSATRAGLDFICLNDHHHMLDTLHLDEEGFYGNVLVLVGLEIGERYNHYLAFDVKEMISPGLGPQEVIDQVNAQGGFGFLAHPFEKGMPFIERSIAYTWNDSTVSGYRGICIWNFTSRWKERVRTAIHGLFFLTFKSQTLKGPSPETLSFWDGVCRQRRVSAVGGSDAHGSVFRWGPIRLLPLSYDRLFETINVHILLNKTMPKALEEAKEAVYGAMKEGRLFIAHEKLRPAKGFRFHFIPDAGAGLVMGEEGHFQPGRLTVELPARGEIRLFRDGNLEWKWRGLRVEHRVTRKGVYRVEAYRHLFLFGWRPWIFSNPIYLR